MKASENPYRMERLERLLVFDPKVMGSSWEELEDRLDGERSGAIVGCKGSGKTTFFEAYEKRLKEKGRRVRLWGIESGESTPSMSRKVEEVGDWLEKSEEGSLAMVDSAGRLGWRSVWRLWFLSWRYRVLVTKHCRSVWWRCLLELRTGEELLIELHEKLGIGELSRDKAEALLDRHSGNMRECFRELYDAVGR